MGVIDMSGGNIFRGLKDDKAHSITLQQCPKCKAFSRDADLCCIQRKEPLLLPPSPLDHHTQDDEMWGHLLGGG